jgi:exonuclease SbcC
MLIHAVELENVKSYAQARVEFTPGVNAIVGHNGAGKSTILEAIGFTLFDALDYSQAEFVRGGAKHGTVTVTFVSSFDDRPYQVVRRVGSGAHYYVFDPDLGARICDGKADVLRFLREHLGVEPGTDLAALFKDAVGVPQGTLTAVFLLADSARKKVFDSLLHVEEYRRAWEQLREPASLIRTRRNALDLDAATMSARLERLPELEKAAESRGQEIAAAEATQATAEAELRVVQQQQAKLEVVRDAVAALEAQSSQAAQRAEGTAVRLSEARQALDEADEARRIVELNADGHRRYVEAQTRQQELDVRQRARQQLERELSVVEKDAALSDSKLTQLQEEAASAREAHARAEGLRAAVEEQARLEAELKEAQQQQARRDDLLRSVDQQAEAVKRLEQRVAELRAGQARAAEVQAQLSAVAELLIQAQTVIGECTESMSGYKTRADLLKEQSQKLEDIRTAVCPVCEQPLTEEHRRDLMTRNDAELTTMRSRYAELQAQRREQESALEAQRAEKERLEAERLALPRADEIASTGQDLERTRRALQDVEAQAAGLGDAPARAERVQAELAELGNPRQRYAIEAEKAGRLSGLEAQVAQAERSVAQTRATLETRQTDLATYAGLDAEIDAVAADLRECQPAHNAVLSHQRAADALAARGQAVAQLEQELAAQRGEAARLREAWTDAAAGYDPVAYQALAGRGQLLQEQIGGVRKQLELLLAAQRDGEQEIVRLHSLREELQATQARQARLVEQEQVLESIRDLLRQAGPYITSALIRQISDGARQIFGEVMQDYTRRLAWDEEYSVTLEVDGQKRQFAQLSGGEQMSAALAVRLALLREMSSIDVAFFDEPTANLDETRREALARQILAVRGFRQIFVISHDDTFEQATQSLVRVQRVDGVSRVMVD